MVEFAGAEYIGSYEDDSNVDSVLWQDYEWKDITGNQDLEDGVLIDYDIDIEDDSIEDAIALNDSIDYATKVADNYLSTESTEVDEVPEDFIVVGKSRNGKLELGDGLMRMGYQQGLDWGKTDYMFMVRTGGNSTDPIIEEDCEIFDSMLLMGAQIKTSQPLGSVISLYNYRTEEYIPKEVYYLGRDALGDTVIFFEFDSSWDYEDIIRVRYSAYAITFSMKEGHLMVGDSDLARVGEWFSAYGSASGGDSLVTLSGTASTNSKNLIATAHVTESAKMTGSPWIVASGSPNRIYTFQENCTCLVDISAYVYNGYTANDSAVVGASINWDSSAGVSGWTNHRSTRYRTPMTTPYTVISKTFIMSFKKGDVFRLMGYNATGSRGTISQSGQTGFRMVRIK